jgi:Protein of unknown function (DUF3562)
MQPAASNPARQRADETNRLESLAQETETSLNLVKAIYLEELRALEKQAKVSTFVAVIAMRRTRLILRSLGSQDEALGVH